MAKIDVEPVKSRFARARAQALESGIVDEKALRSRMENDRRIAEIRGLLLNRTAELEHQMNLFLAWYFTRDEKASLEFYDLLLSREFFTLHQKITLFGDIGYHKAARFKGKFDGLTGQLHTVKEMRNLIAHGHKASDSEPLVRMLTKKAPVKLDERFIAGFKDAFESAFFSLVELNEDIRRAVA